RRKTGKAKNDAMPPKVRMVAPDGKQVFEPSHYGHPWAKKWANLQPMYQEAIRGPVPFLISSSDSWVRFVRIFTQFTITSYAYTGKWRECSTVFEVKRRNSARMMGIAHF